MTYNLVLDDHELDTVQGLLALRIMTVEKKKKEAWRAYQKDGSADHLAAFNQWQDKLGQAESLLTKTMLAHVSEG